MKPTGAVYLHYTQEELDRNYDQRGWCPTALDHIAKQTADSEFVRRSGKFPFQTYSYGDHEDDTLDFFGCARLGAPTVIFIHGGAWRNFSKNDFSFVAPPFVESGINCAILNFSKLPERRLPDVVDQLRRSISWLYLNSAKYGVNPDRIYVCGHSSGAHLAAVLISRIWAAHEKSAAIIRGAALLSGSYDLEPAILSARGSYIKLTKKEEWDLSPIHFAKDLSCPVLVAYTQNDTDEFKRQSEAFAAAAARAKKLFGTMCLPRANHFSILEELTVTQSPLLGAILRMIK
jgi:arylformamidase